MKTLTFVVIAAALSVPHCEIWAADKNMKTSEQGKQGATGGLGLTNRPGAGGGMGEDTTPAGSPDGPRALPPGRAPGYEGADKGKVATPRVGSQRDFSPPTGLPEDPVPRAGSGR